MSRLLVLDRIRQQAPQHPGLFRVFGKLEKKIVAIDVLPQAQTLLQAYETDEQGLQGLVSYRLNTKTDRYVPEELEQIGKNMAAWYGYIFKHDKEIVIEEMTTYLEEEYNLKLAQVETVLAVAAKYYLQTMTKLGVGWYQSFTEAEVDYDKVLEKIAWSRQKDEANRKDRAKVQKLVKQALQQAQQLLQAYETDEQGLQGITKNKENQEFHDFLINLSQLPNDDGSEKRLTYNRKTLL